MLLTVTGIFLIVIGIIVYNKIKGSPSVDNIVSDIVQKVEQLHLVKDIKHAEAEAHDATVQQYQRLKELALKEKDRAQAIADKLIALVT